MFARSLAQEARGHETFFARSFKLRFGPDRYYGRAVKMLEQDDVLVLQFTDRLAAQAKENVRQARKAKKNIPRGTTAEIRRYLATSGSLPGYFVRCDRVKEYLQLLVQNAGSNLYSDNQLDQLNYLNRAMSIPEFIQAVPAEKLEPVHELHEKKRPEARMVRSFFPHLGGVPAVEAPQ